MVVVDLWRVCFKACQGFCCLLCGLCDFSETINGTMLIQRWVVPSLNTMASFKDSHTINECINYFTLFPWIKANGKHQNKWFESAITWSLMWSFNSCILNSLIKGLIFSLLQKPKNLRREKLDVDEAVWKAARKAKSNKNKLEHFGLFLLERTQL